MDDQHRNYWQERRCLITGGLGFCGSHLAQQLLERHAKIYIIDHVLRNNSYLMLTGLNNQVEFIQGDIRDLKLLKDILQRNRIETVFHLAAQPIVPVSNLYPYDTLSNNAMGTYSVLEAIRTASPSCAMIFASSGAYYGTTFQKEPIDEKQAPEKASNIYSPSKVAGDIAVRCYAEVYGMKTAACRFMNAYGPGSTNIMTIVPRAIGRLLAEEPYDFGTRDDGTTVLDFLYVQDMARGYISVAEKIEHISGDAFNFGGGNPISINELVRLIGRIFDGKEHEPIFRGPKRNIPVSKLLDTRKAKTILDWQPSVSLVDGLKETIRWYRLHKKSYDWENFEG